MALLTSEITLGQSLLSSDIAIPCAEVKLSITRDAKAALFVCVVLT